MGKNAAAGDTGDTGGGRAAGSTAELDPEEQWLRSWAFATSPYGLGLSTRRSWELTPREFRALETVYHQSLYRWAIERATFMNAHWKKQDGSQWTPDDFVDTPESRARKQQAVVDKMELAAMKREEARQLRLMRSGQFPEEQLPVWARMTPEEKAARGIK